MIYASPPPRDDIPLRVDSLTKAYGRFVAVDAVSLAMRPGEVLALLGPNGAGKTTFISCITGLATPDSGSVSVFGYDTQRDYRQARRLMGVVPQEVNFDPFFSPFESLLLQMGLMGVRPDAAWAETLLRELSLSDHRDAYARHLSGGMKRRLLIAKALVHRPRVLFLDEPTAGVDVELRRDLWRLVARLRDEGSAIVLTTHYLEEAERLADRVGVLRSGRLLLVEDQQTLMRRYGRSEIVIRGRRLLATWPSWLEPRVREEEDALVIELRDPSETPALIESLRDHIEIHDIMTRRSSLEEVFLHLVHEDQDGAQGSRVHHDKTGARP